MTLSADRKSELKSEVERTFEQFKEQYSGFIQTPMRDSVQKIESLGIFVLISAAPEEVSGFCMTIGENTFIFINKSQVVGRQNYSLWHEVYHWYTESTGLVSMSGEKDNNEIEFSADYFASLVLIDKDYLNRRLNSMGFNKKPIKYLSYDEIIQLQHHFKVSYSAMVRKIMELYPDSELGQRYSLGYMVNKKKFIEKTKRLGLDLDLIFPSKNTYISSELFDILKKLLSENKITQTKVESLLEIIEKELI